MEELDLEGLATYIRADAIATDLMIREMSELLDSDNPARLHAASILIEHQLELTEQFGRKLLET